MIEIADWAEEESQLTFNVGFRRAPALIYKHYRFPSIGAVDVIHRACPKQYFCNVVEILATKRLPGTPILLNIQQLASYVLMSLSSSACVVIDL